MRPSSPSSSAGASRCTAYTHVQHSWTDLLKLCLVRGCFVMGAPPSPFLLATHYTTRCVVMLVILLLKLLVGMFGATFSQVQLEATLEWRQQLARSIINLERVRISRANLAIRVPW